MSFPLDHCRVAESRGFEPHARRHTRFSRPEPAPDRLDFPDASGGSRPFFTSAGADAPPDRVSMVPTAGVEPAKPRGLSPLSLPSPHIGKCGHRLLTAPTRVGGTGEGSRTLKKPRSERGDLAIGPRRHNGCDLRWESNPGGESFVRDRLSRCGACAPRRHSVALPYQQSFADH